MLERASVLGSRFLFARRGAAAETQREKTVRAGECRGTKGAAAHACRARRRVVSEISLARPSHGIAVVPAPLGWKLMQCQTASGV